MGVPCPALCAHTCGLPPAASAGMWTGTFPCHAGWQLCPGLGKGDAQPLWLQDDIASRQGSLGRRRSWWKRDSGDSRTFSSMSRPEVGVQRAWWWWGGRRLRMCGISGSRPFLRIWGHNLAVLQCTGTAGVTSAHAARQEGAKLCGCLASAHCLQARQAAPRACASLGVLSPLAQALWNVW